MIINKVLKEDTTLGERLKTLFREQGITIVSILTAIGMMLVLLLRLLFRQVVVEQPRHVNYRHTFESRLG